MNTKEMAFFKKALWFVIVAYVCIKFIDQYRLLFGWVGQFVGITWPFILGAIFAYAINPLANYFEKLLKGRRGISILCAYVLIIALIAAGFSFVVPVIYKNIIDLVNTIPTYVEQLQNFYATNLEGMGLDVRIAEMVREMGVKFLPYLGNVLTGSVNVIVNVAANTIALTINVFIVIFISYYKFGRAHV